VRLDWIGLDWIDWVGLVWFGLDWNLHWVRGCFALVGFFVVLTHTLLREKKHRCRYVWLTLFAPPIVRLAGALGIASVVFGEITRRAGVDVVGMVASHCRVELSEKKKY
jgi:hypothetical protein